MMTPKLSYVLALLLALCSGAQAQMKSQLTFRRYTTQDGLPQMQAERLWQDSRGYIYIGTLSGFVRFDGRGFTPFLKGRRVNIVGFTEVAGEDATPGAQPGEVRALGFFRQWRVDYDGVEPMALDPAGHWLLNNLNAGSLPDGYVLVEDSLEQHRRLCRMTKQGLEPLSLDEKLFDEMTPDRKLYYEPKSRKVLVPTGSGLWQMEAGEGPKRRGKTVRLTDKGNVYSLLRTDSALLAFAADGIYRVGGKGLKLIQQADWTEASYGLTVRMLRSGGVVVADEHRVYEWDGRTVREIVGGLNLIRDVLVDRWDRLWVATYQGVYCLFNRGFTNHWLDDAGDIVRAVATDAGGRLVTGSLNGKLMVGERLIDSDAQQFYAPSAVRMGDGVYMAGNGDVACVRGDTLSWLGLPRDRYQFVASGWGQLIVGSRTGIYAWHPATRAVDTLTTGILHPWCVAEDADGLLWVGSSGGLFSIDKARRVSKTEFGAQKLTITALVGDSRGRIYFASADSVFTIRERRVVELNSQLPQLASHEVRALHVSPRGFLVVATVDGLFVCRLGTDGALGDVRFFNHLNGFTMTEPLKAVMAEDADGTVWLPGVEQMTSFRPEELLAHHEEDCYIEPPLRWWQHWWVWLIGVLLLAVAVWGATRWYEARRNRRRLIRLQREKLWREELIESIRQKAIKAETDPLAKDIVEMTEEPPVERLTLRTASGMLVVDVKDIACFKGDGNYSQIVMFHGKDTVLMGLGALERMLSKEIFVRADRSTLVNIHYVCNLLPKQRRCVFRSPSGQEVEVTLLAPAFKRLQQLL